MPPKYRDMMTFYKYYKGEAAAPYPTLFSACAPGQPAVPLIRCLLCAVVE